MTERQRAAASWAAPETEPPRISLLQLFPGDTRAGAVFNRQPDGRAALAVGCRNATAATRIVFRGVGLPTVYEGSELLTACVPSELYTGPGLVDVYLRDADHGESNRLTFRVSADGVADPEEGATSRPAHSTGNADPSLRILVLHFGSWPEWFPLFLETCRWNPTIDWLILTDCLAPESMPENVQVRRESCAGVEQRIADKLGYRVPIEFAYKLCDLRLAFARVFDDLVAEYDFLGWSDLDVVYGDIRRHLSREALENDVVTFYEEHLSGHLTLIRNTPAIRELHLQVPDFQTRVVMRDYQRLDEPPPDLLRARFPVWAKQSYNTPLSPYAAWRDGTFIFPKEWHWRQGRLTNDLDGDTEFLYLHFMHWKGGPWPRECGNAQWERLTRVVHFDPSRASGGFLISERGFFPLDPLTRERA